MEILAYIVAPILRHVFKVLFDESRELVRSERIVLTPQILKFDPVKLHLIVLQSFFKKFCGLAKFSEAEGVVGHK